MEAVSEEVAEGGRGASGPGRIDAASLVDDSAAGLGGWSGGQRETRHLYDFTAFDMTVVFLSMTCFLTFFSAFGRAASIVFVLDLAAAVVLQTVHNRAIKNFIVSLAVISYCCLVATQSTTQGASLNFFWSIPFVFLMTGFRFITLIAICLTVGVVHVMWIAVSTSPSTDLFKNQEIRAFVVVFDLVAFGIAIGLGAAIYDIFFVQHRLVNRLRRKPDESLEAIPYIASLELDAFSNVPLGLLVGYGGALSEEQHVALLLRCHQNNPFRDSTLQLLRLTDKELAVVGVALDPTSTYGIYTSRATYSREGPGAGRRRPKAVIRVTNTIRNEPGADGKLQFFPSAGVRVPLMSEEFGQEMVDLRAFLRSAICQLFLESHPNRELCEVVLGEKFFHCTKQQRDATLASYAERRANAHAAGLYSPRLRLNGNLYRLWSGGVPTPSTPIQSDELPTSFNEFLSLNLVRMKALFENQVGNPFATVLSATETDRSTKPRSTAALESVVVAPSPQNPLIKKSPMKLQIMADEERRFFEETKRKPITKKKEPVTGVPSFNVEVYSSERSPDYRRPSTPTSRHRRRLSGKFESIAGLPAQKPKKGQLRDWSLLYALIGCDSRPSIKVTKDGVAGRAPEENRMAPSSGVGNDENVPAPDPSKKRRGYSKCMAQSKGRRKRGRRDSLSEQQKYSSGLVGTVEAEGGCLKAVRHAGRSLYNFHLPSATFSEADKQLMVSHFSFGEFQDVKMERWYLSWATTMEARMAYYLRNAHFWMSGAQVLMGAFITFLKFAIAFELGNIQVRQVIFLTMGVFIVFLQAALCTFTTKSVRSEGLKSLETVHAVKIRNAASGIIMCIFGMAHFFVHYENILTIPIEETSDYLRLLAVAAQSSREINLLTALLSFSITCICTEQTIILFLFTAIAGLFVIMPVIGYLTHVWPPNIGYALGKAPDAASSSVSESFGMHYLVLFHQYAPCLMLQYLVGRAIQKTLRHHFQKQVLVYLLYLDALALPEQSSDEEEEDESEADM